ncbi:DUF4395 family protein [Modestobacter versicolor]|uniref:DUF4395 family protein n=1 Tax=Modestobacter versicolor TaxID=429133 RepID=UPI0034DEDC43
MPAAPAEAALPQVDVGGPGFAQLVGLLFAAVGAAGYLSGAPVLGAVATGLALVAALLNAATGSCLGCELYPTVRRAQTARTS